MLQIKRLTVSYPQQQSYAIQRITLSVAPGQSIGIIGESGSGKSTIAHAIMGILHKEAAVTGTITYNNIDLLRCKQATINQIRWHDIALVFQNSLDVFNPTLTIEQQLMDVLLKEKKVSKKEARATLLEILIHLEFSEEWLPCYPHELSGGMRQKALIAMALVCKPKLLIIDEPTTALDSIAKQQTIDLIKRLQQQFQFALIVISHELPVIEQLAEHVAVLYAGKIVEYGPTATILERPAHPYTKGLIMASPSLNPYRDLWGIPAVQTSTASAPCAFYDRCFQKADCCLTNAPTVHCLSEQHYVSCSRGGILPLLQANHVSKSYQKAAEKIDACKGCNLSIDMGEIVALIGQSGSGKSTLAEMIAGLQLPDDGTVSFNGQPFMLFEQTQRRGGIQFIHQDPYTAINEQLSVQQIVEEPRAILKIGNKAERLDAICEALRLVQLPADSSFLQRKAFSLSGGQRQRLAIARALSMEPQLLIADEINTMLDPSNSANLMRLLKGIQNETGFSMLFVTHDLPLAQKIADRIYIMQNGEIIEEGSTAKIFSFPTHPFTQQLISLNRSFTSIYT